VKDDLRRRLQDVYRKRDGTAAVASRYGAIEPATVFLAHDRMWRLSRLLRSGGLVTLAGLDVLDVGCGSGGELRNLVPLGLSHDRSFGIDVLPERLDAGGFASVAAADARALPFPGASFDIVMQSTVFTSVREPADRRAIAGEMQRVLRPGGLVIWYDFYRRNPRNPDVIPVRRSELVALFAGCDLAITRVTLAPPLARALLPRGTWVARLLSAVPLLRTHHLALIRKPLDHD
jgi:ubiquinone/menaquinone biosynthesis C-methylase UbiE